MSSDMSTFKYTEKRPNLKVTGEYTVGDKEYRLESRINVIDVVKMNA
jgi:hypothetical protein